MLRIIGLLLLGAVLFLVYLPKNKKLSRPGNPANPSAKMVSCARCQLYLPETEAIQQQGQYFCCAAHANDQQA